MSQQFEVPSGSAKEFMSAIFCEPEKKPKESNAKTLVIMVHGYPGSHKQAHEDLFGDLEFLFTSSGFHTLRFDFTLKSAAEDMDSILDWANKQGFEKIIYVAEGLGATHIVPKLNDTTKLVFFFWPILDLKSYADTYFASDGQGHEKFENHDIPKALIDEMRATDLTEKLKDLKPLMLMQYGDQDEIFDETQLEFFKTHTKAPRIDITGYQDGNHGLTGVRHRQMIFYHIGQFLSKFAA